MQIGKVASDFVNHLERKHFVGMRYVLRYLYYPEIYEQIFYRAGVTLDMIKRINDLREKDPRRAHLMSFNAIEYINDAID